MAACLDALPADLKEMLSLCSPELKRQARSRLIEDSYVVIHKIIVMG